MFHTAVLRNSCSLQRTDTMCWYTHFQSPLFHSQCHKVSQKYISTVLTKNNWFMTLTSETNQITRTCNYAHEFLLLCLLKCVNILIDNINSNVNSEYVRYLLNVFPPKITFSASNFSNLSQMWFPYIMGKYKNMRCK